MLKQNVVLFQFFFKFVHKSTKRQTVTQQHQSKNKPIYLDSEIQHTIIPRVKSSRQRTFFSKFKKLPCQDIEPAECSLTITR